MFTAPALLVMVTRGRRGFLYEKRGQAGTCGGLVHLESLAGEEFQVEMKMCMEKIQQLC